MRAKHEIGLGGDITVSTKVVTHLRPSSVVLGDRTWRTQEGHKDVMACRGAMSVHMSVKSLWVIHKKRQTYGYNDKVDIVFLYEESSLLIKLIIVKS